MGDNTPNQPQKTIKFYCFSEAVNWYLKAKGMKQADLIKKSCLSKTTISRICRNSNDKGKYYLPSIQIVIAISIGFKLNRKQAEELMFCAFPEMEFWGSFLDKHLSIDEANEILDDNGIPLLGGET